MSSSINTTSPIKISVIGGRQAGKTTLAAGLFAANRPGFVVDSEDTTTRTYLTGLKETLQNGKWPLGTGKGTNYNLNLNLKYKGREPIGLDFFDYAGEKLQNMDEIKAFLAKANGSQGVAILVNPGMDSFQKPSERTQLVEIYKLVIQKLKSEGCTNYCAGHR